MLIKSADLFVESSEKIGFALKISPFIVGVTIVALGTSLPELISSIAAVFKGVTEIIPANAVGSNVANILLIIGLAAIAAKKLIVKRSLIDLDAPLLAAVTFIFIFVVADDRKISSMEGGLLILGFLVYLLYTIFQRGEEKALEADAISPVSSSAAKAEEEKERLSPPEEKSSKLNFNVFLFLILGMLGLAIGANYTVDSVINISKILAIPSSLITITALAIGTSLPELIVSVRAALKKKYEVALGNVFGSNVFNLLLVIGLPALIKPLTVDALTFEIGIPFLAAATLLFVISGISKKIHIWEGAMYVILYILFMAKICGAF